MLNRAEGAEEELSGAVGKSEPAVEGAADGVLGVGGDEGVDGAAARGEVVVHAGLVGVAAEGTCKIIIRYNQDIK